MYFRNRALKLYRNTLFLVYYTSVTTNFILSCGCSKFLLNAYCLIEQEVQPLAFHYIEFKRLCISNFQVTKIINPPSSLNLHLCNISPKPVPTRNGVKDDDDNDDQDDDDVTFPQHEDLF